MKNLLTLGLLLALPTLALADVEGMVLIDDAFYIDIYEYPNQRGTPAQSRRHLGRSGIAVRGAGQAAVYRTGMAESLHRAAKLRVLLWRGIRAGALQYALCRRWGLATRTGPSAQRRVSKLY